MSTAAEIRNRIIPVSFGDGSTLTIACRRPDPFTLITQDLLPLPLFHAVLEKFATWADEGGASTPALMGAMAEDPKRWSEFTDRWVCAAAVDPIVVLTEEEADTNPEALWIDELEFPTKMAILSASFSRKLVSPRVRSAIEHFRRGLPPGTGGGPESAHSSQP